MAELSIVLAGGTGFLGTHLREALRGRGHSVTSLTRRAPRSSAESRWDPDHGELDQAVVEGADVVVNLAGSPLMGNPHSTRWAREVHDSRVRTTAVLADAVARSDPQPAFLAGNGISYYGDHGDAVLTEVSDTRGHALLTRVARDWEAATRPAAEAGSRVCVLRTSPVMDRRAAPLKQLRLLFKAGLGGRLGSGGQYMPMSSLRDWVGAATHLAEHPTASGPFNICAPDPPTNAEFTRALAAAVGRPSVVPVPAPVLRVGAGDLSPELLGSLNARPAALENAGYEFADRDVDAVLATGLGHG